MSLSVNLVIPTYKRHKVLRDLLNHINDTHFNDVDKYDFSIWVLDQSPEEFEYDNSAYRYKFNYTRLDIPGLPNARNWALQNLNSDILIFIDDDVELDEAFIKNHVEPYETNREIGAIAGKIIEDDNTKQGINYSKRATSKLYGINILGIYYQNRGGDKKVHALGFPGGNFSLSRSAIESVGLFDIDFGGNAQLEETDYAYRLRKKGYQILFNPGAKLIHFAISSGGVRLKNGIKKNYWRLHNTTYFTLKNRTLILFPIYFVSAILISFIMAFKTSDFSKNWKVIKDGIFDGIKTYRQ